MTNLTHTVTIVLLVMLCTSVGTCQSLGDSIAESHVKANVREEKDFDVFMKRDLTEYFKEAKKQSVVIEYELLRKGATQSGTAFPKFYAWVIVRADGKLIEEGAVKVAAMEKKRFGVYDYLPRIEIERTSLDCRRYFQLWSLTRSRRNWVSDSCGPAG